VSSIDYINKTDELNGGKSGSSLDGINRNAVDVYNFDDEVMEESNNKTYVVGSWANGEKFSTIWAISQDSGVSVDDIMAANPWIAENNGVYHPGDKIIVPIKSSGIEISQETTSTNENVISTNKSNSDNKTNVVETVDLEIDEIKEEPKKEVIVNNGELKQSVEVPSSVKQTGICRNYTNYSYFYEKLNGGTKQRELADLWDSKGRTNDRGIATLDGNYLVAVSPMFGKVGDKIEVVLEDGSTINCVVADQKGVDATSPYGHHLGNSGVDIIEWESFASKDTIELGDWRNKDVVKINNYGSYEA